MSHDSHHDLHDDQEDPAAGTTWVVSLASIFILVATVLALVGWWEYTVDVEQEKKVLEQPNAEYEALKASQMERLSHQRIERRLENVGTENELSVVIPLDEAIRLELQEASQR